jgi:multidrug efflux pump subunit AcrB
MIARLGPKFRQIRGGRAVPLAPPPIIGLGTGGGFSYVLQDAGGGSAQSLAQVLRGLLVHRFRGTNQLWRVANGEPYIVV